MIRRNLPPSAALALAAVLAGAMFAPGAPVRTGHAEAELLARVVSVAPGDSFDVALRLRPDPDWHVYWSNPGDAGLPPKPDWTLPPGWTAGALRFPVPERIPVPPFASYGYSREVWYLARVAAPEDASGAETLRLRAEWLICREECVPESAELEVTVGVGETTPDARAAARWKEALARLPEPAPAWNWRAEWTADSLFLSWDLPAESALAPDLLFFAGEGGVIAHAAPQRARRDGNRAVLALERDAAVGHAPARLTGVLAWEQDGVRRGLALDVTPPDATEESGFTLATGAALVLTVAALVLLIVFRRPHVSTARRPNS